MKLLLNKYKSFNILCGIYLFMLIADLASTLLNWGLIKYLESNPLYKYGGLPLIILMNLVLFAGYYLWYKNTKNFNVRYYLTLALTMVCLIRVGVVINNVIVAMNPPTLAQAMAVTEAQKVEYYKSIVIPNVMPFFAGVFAWLFFKGDHKIEEK